MWSTGKFVEISEDYRLVLGTDRQAETKNAVTGNTVDEITMNDLLAGLMLWIAMNSTYDTADLPLPSVVPMNAEELTREAYGDVPGIQIHQFDCPTTQTAGLLLPESKKDSGSVAKTKLD